MKLGGRDYLRQLLHVCWLYVDNVEALILDIEVPEVYSEVIAADESLPIAVDRYAVDVICVGIGIGSARDSSNNGIVVRKTGKLQIAGSSECHSSRPWRSSPSDNGRGRVVRQIVLCYYFQRLLKNLPQLDSLVVCREQVVRRILAPTPFNLVDLFLDLERLEVVEFWFVRLKLGMKLILTRLLLRPHICLVSYRVRKSQERSGVILPALDGRK